MTLETKRPLEGVLQEVLRRRFVAAQPERMQSQLVRMRGHSETELALVERSTIGRRGERNGHHEA
jgi:hypothetical protein